MKAWKGFPKEYWMYRADSSLAGEGSNILQYLLSLYVLELTGSGTRFASMLSIIVFPKILISPFAGVAADRAPAATASSAARSAPIVKSRA